MSRFNVGDTVYYLSGTETYRFVRSGTIERFSLGRGYHVAEIFLTIHEHDVYPTEEEAKAARLDYYNREVEDAQKALDNARARLSNAVGWRERAEAEAQE